MQRLEERQLDYRTLARETLFQAMRDYTSLQHPKTRRRKYLQEAFESAVDLFFDPDFTLMSFEDGFGEDMTTEEFVRIATGFARADVEKLKTHLIETSLAFWDKKEMKTVEIPDTIVIEGHIYYVEHVSSPDVELDLDSKRIYLNRDAKDSENQERFVVAVMELTMHHQEVRLSAAKRKDIARAWFRTLRMNNCFTGV